MTKICLALPTNRECANTINLLHAEAKYAAKAFNVTVCFLLIDTSREEDLGKNRYAVRHLDKHPNVDVRHVDHEQQKNFFATLFSSLDFPDAERLTELMLPEGVSYGACTNRAFLLATALGCDSVHRRDSDCHYQIVDGNIIFPIHQELLSLGKTANSVSDPSIANELNANQQDMPVAMVAASFIGEMSVDIEEIRQLSPSIYSSVVRLWAAKGTTKEHQDALVEESFKGAGNAVYTSEQATLGSVDPMLVDMCNISFYGIHKAAPLPPAKDTIGSDYFLLHLIYHSGLPGVVHNRHITNFYTPERKTDDGFIKYQRRFIKFMLSMPYLHTAYKEMALAGPHKLLDKNYSIHSGEVCRIIAGTIDIDNEHCYYVLDEIIKNYRLLGGRYEKFAGLLVEEKEALIRTAKQDMEDYLFLAKNWSQLINLSQELKPMFSYHFSETPDTHFQEDEITFDLGGIRQQFIKLSQELPTVDIRFAIKSCAVNEVLETLVDVGSGFDAASIVEIKQALWVGGNINRIHYGNTIKSDRQIAEAHELGIADYAADSLDEIRAIAKFAPGRKVFCRLATDGKGAVYGLSRKFGSSEASVISNLVEAKKLGLVPAGISVHIGSQQMSEHAWQSLFRQLQKIALELKNLGIVLEYINLGGGLPAKGYSDKSGLPLKPNLAAIFAAMREGMASLRKEINNSLAFILEPGRFLVADFGVIRAHVLRLSKRVQPEGKEQYWLFLSCGRFNGLYETDALRYQMIFPGHDCNDTVECMIAGPTCDSADVLTDENHLISVPRSLKSGDAVWLLSCGAYSTSYSTVGFNGFKPLKRAFIRDDGINLASHGALDLHEKIKRRANLARQQSLQSAYPE